MKLIGEITTVLISDNSANTVKYETTVGNECEMTIIKNKCCIEFDIIVNSPKEYLHLIKIKNSRRKCHFKFTQINGIIYHLSGYVNGVVKVNMNKSIATISAIGKITAINDLDK